MFARLLTVLDGRRWKEVRATLDPVFAPAKASLVKRAPYPSPQVPPGDGRVG